MKVDLYTKAVLTVIAVALVALVVSDYTQSANALTQKGLGARGSAPIRALIINKNPLGVRIANKNPLGVRVKNAPEVVIKNIPQVIIKNVPEVVVKNFPLKGVSK